jgi:hypothetical protein
VKREVDSGRPGHLFRGHVLGLTGEQSRPVDAVAADVHQRPSVQLGERTDVRLVLEHEAERSADEPHPAERALRDQFGDAVRLRVVAVHERLHQDEAGLVRAIERLVHLCRVPRVGLLAQHVLAGVERSHRPLVVEAVRQRVVDSVDVGIVEELLVGAVRSRNRMLERVRLRAQRLARRDRDELDGGRRRRSAKALERDVGG